MDVYINSRSEEKTANLHEPLPRQLFRSGYVQQINIIFQQRPRGREFAKRVFVFIILPLPYARVKWIIAIYFPSSSHELFVGANASFTDPMSG